MTFPGKDTINKQSLPKAPNEEEMGKTQCALTDMQKKKKKKKKQQKKTKKKQLIATQEPRHDHQKITMVLNLV